MEQMFEVAVQTALDQQAQVLETKTRELSAIIAKLDFTYADKTPIQVIQQELNLMRQGDMPSAKYSKYEVGKN